MDRFDLEQQILDCWKITDDIAMMESQGANTADMTSLACVYEYKFKRLWEIFEGMVNQRQFKSTEEFFESGRDMARKLDKKNKKHDSTNSQTLFRS